MLDVRESDRARSAVSAVVALARSLQLEVVAEGVEDDATMELLAGLGCDRVQGFVIAPGLPPAQLTKILGDVDQE